jgi:hypothetical protein
MKVWKWVKGCGWAENTFFHRRLGSQHSLPFYRWIEGFFSQCEFQFKLWSKCAQDRENFTSERSNAPFSWNEKIIRRHALSLLDQKETEWTQGNEEELFVKFLISWMGLFPSTSDSIPSLKRTCQTCACVCVSVCVCVCVCVGGVREYKSWICVKKFLRQVFHNDCINIYNDHIVRAFTMTNTNRLNFHNDHTGRIFQEIHNDRTAVPWNIWFIDTFQQFLFPHTILLLWTKSSRVLGNDIPFQRWRRRREVSRKDSGSIPVLGRKFLEGIISGNCSFSHCFRRMSRKFRLGNFSCSQCFSVQISGMVYKPASFDSKISRQ